MLTRHRRHHRDVEPAVARPLQRQRMGRGLHHDAVVAGVDHAREQLLQLERLRRRVAVVVRNDLVEDADLDRSDLARMPSAAPQHLRGQGDHRRLAVGARHADDGQLLARSSEPRVRGIGQGVPAVRHHQLRDRCIRELSLDDQRRSRRSRSASRRSRARRRGRRERRRTACPGATAPRVVGERRDLPDRDADHPFGADDVGQCAPAPCSSAQSSQPAARDARRGAQPVEGGVHDEVPAIRPSATSRPPKPFLKSPTPCHGWSGTGIGRSDAPQVVMPDAARAGEAASSPTGGRSSRSASARRAPRAGSR